MAKIFDNYSTTTKQTLVAYNANSLAPYTLLECICDITNNDEDHRGIDLIYSKINQNISASISDSASSLSNNQYLLVWDNTNDSQSEIPKFKVLNFGTSGSSASGNSAASVVFGDGGKFFDRVKYAESLYYSDVAAYGNGKYIPYLNVTQGLEQSTGYLKCPSDNATNNSTQALVYRDGSIGWGSAGALLSQVSDTVNPVAYYLVANAQGNVSTESVAPDTLYYDTRIYFMSGSLYHASDESLKTFIGDIDINLDNLATIKKGMFYWKSDPDKITNLGVSAQSVEALYPELVTSVDGHLSVDYSKLSVVALAAIDKLNERIKELEKQIEELKK